MLQGPFGRSGADGEPFSGGSFGVNLSLLGDLGICRELCERTHTRLTMATHSSPRDNAASAANA